MPKSTYRTPRTLSSLAILNALNTFVLVACQDALLFPNGLHVLSLGFPDDRTAGMLGSEPCQIDRLSFVLHDQPFIVFLLRSGSPSAEACARQGTWRMAKVTKWIQAVLCHGSLFHRRR